METVAGRKFSEEFGAESISSFIINEAAVAAMGSTPEEVLGREAWRFVSENVCRRTTPFVIPNTM